MNESDPKRMAGSGYGRRAIVALSAFMVGCGIACKSWGQREPHPYDGAGTTTGVKLHRPHCIHAHIRHSLSNTTMMKAKLKVGFRDEEGYLLGSKFFYLTDMNLPPNTKGSYRFSVPDDMKSGLDGIFLLGAWTWQEDGPVDPIHRRTE